VKKKREMTGDELRIKGIIRGCEITRRNLGPLAGTGQLMKDVLWLAGEVRRLQSENSALRQMCEELGRALSDMFFYRKGNRCPFCGCAEFDEERFWPKTQFATLAKWQAMKEKGDE